MSMSSSLSPMRGASLSPMSNIDMFCLTDKRADLVRVYTACISILSQHIRIMTKNQPRCDRLVPYCFNSAVIGNHHAIISNGLSKLSSK